jgi:GntR family transcriptional regulator
MKSKPRFLPLYQQVKSSLIKRISSGEWPPGSFLPSETALAQKYGVSQGTLRKALIELTNDRCLVRYQGKGTAVATFESDQGLFRFLRICGKDGKKVQPVSRQISGVAEAATPEESKELKIATGGAVYRIERIRLIQGQPVINEVITLPLDLFPGIDSIGTPNLPNTLYDLFHKRYGIIVALVQERLDAVAATATDARRVRVSAGDPLLRIRRLAFDLQGMPIELRDSRCRTDCYQYVNEIR